MAEGNYPVVSTTSSTDSDIEKSDEEAGAMACHEDEALQRFLQQQRSDLMFELRHIQHGERPVTGQNHRENIASFMAKHTQEAAGAAGKANVPANVDAVEEHRPEAVLVEVQGVVEQRRVSSMLQTPNFRRHLENIIRGSISSARQSVSASAAAAARARASSSPSPPAAEPQVVSRGQTPPQETERVSRGAAAAAAVTPPPSRVAEPAPSRSSPAEQAPAGANHDGERGMWNTISQVHHEEMIYEISDLLHRRLVSTALGSEFRSLMELHIENQVAQRGSDREREAVADFVRNIRQSEVHIPNDFRHLGIDPSPRDDNSDNISITGISATAVPYTQTNRYMSREIQSLKSQMEEMKNMLRLSFDLQMDIQRSIRQEVAAALASVTGASATAAPEVRSTPVNDTHCLICLDNHADSVLYQCGHMCICYTCGRNLITRGNAKCPVCRAPIKDIIRAYKTNTE